jgi:threonine synthase
MASLVLRPFFEGDPLAADLPAIAAAAFAPPIPVTAFEEAFVLELFHGPTAAFKDFGARFLAECLERRRVGRPRPLTVLVATSGDTGGAVAAAFHRRAWAEVVILFPRGRISARQERQITCWGENVRAFAVEGSFDDCQRIARAAFQVAELAERRELSSANSINLGRLLPQVVAYAAASREVLAATGSPASFIVPSGNVGNAVAGAWAREMGFPIRDLVLAHNANRTVPDYLATGLWRPRPGMATLATAMDVGDPGNMERLRDLYPSWETLRKRVEAWSVSDEEIRSRIREDYRRTGRVWCPHTAVAAHVYARLPAARRSGAAWVIVATAHPAKFEEIVEPLIGRTVEVPAPLMALLARPARSEPLAPRLEALLDVL